MDQITEGRLRDEDKVNDVVAPARTVTLPVPASNSPWKRVAV